MLGVLPLGSAPDTAAVNGQARVFVAHEDGAAESCAALHCAADVLGCFGEPSESFPCLTCMMLWLPRPCQHSQWGCVYETEWSMAVIRWVPSW